MYNFKDITGTINIYDNVFENLCELKNYFDIFIESSFQKTNQDIVKYDTKQVNLKWVRFFEESEIESFGFLKLYKSKIPLLDNKTILKQYLNLSTFETIDEIHKDDGNLTIVQFMNPSWNANWFGELIFLNDEQTEIRLSILPKPGRIVIFDNNINHSARVPSRSAEFPRLTLTTKLI